MVTTAYMAAALIAVFEGCRLEAYQDPGGVWTIGFGHTSGVKQGDVCTLGQAIAWLMQDSAPLFTAVAVISDVNDAAALVSFGYNTGYSNLKKALLNRREILNPVHTTDRKGNVLAGLVSRRKLEAALCGVMA